MLLPDKHGRPLGESFVSKMQLDPNPGKLND